MLLKSKYYKYLKCFYATSSEEAKKIVLKDPRERYKLPLIEKTIINHNVRKFRFGLPSKEHVLGLPVGQYIHLSATINGKLEDSCFSPVTSDYDQGHVDLIVKVHLDDTLNNFHPITHYLETMKIGDTIDFRGPEGRLKYIDAGMFAFRPRSDDILTIVKALRVNLIACGVGITPFLQLMSHIQKDPKDTTKCALLLTCTSQEDIVVKDQLEAIRSQDPEQFKIWYTLECPPPGWKYSRGFIDANMLKEYLFCPSKDTINLMCGSLFMVKLCMSTLQNFGHKKHLLFSY